MTDVWITGFKSQSTVLAKLFRLVEGGDIQAPLFDPSAAEPGMTNSRFVAEYSISLLSTAFPHLQAFVLFFLDLVLGKLILVMIEHKFKDLSPIYKHKIKIQSNLKFHYEIS